MTRREQTMAQKRQLGNEIIIICTTCWTRTFTLLPMNIHIPKRFIAASKGIGIHVVIGAQSVLCESGTLAQEYITNPLLIRGFKFDLRLYVVLMGYDPLRIFLYRDGIVRFASQLYDPHSTSQFSNLTNFSINKGRIKTCMNQKDIKKVMQKQQIDENNPKNELQFGADDRVVMRRIQDVLIKLFISADSTFVKENRSLLHFPSNCAELYGVDIMLDANMKPYILEVNTSPSVQAGSPLDDVVKGNMLSDYLFMQGHTPYVRNNQVPIVQLKDIYQWIKQFGKRDEKEEIIRREQVEQEQEQEKQEEKKKLMMILNRENVNINNKVKKNEKDENKEQNEITENEEEKQSNDSQMQKYNN
ncbi:MAG: putative tubulin polyglutamylase TTLL5 [Streblomastix strix]|uniref:Tubulin--tyrosine ligase-like protein 5 n=1 Tax=Streblomastix strix TaxID=222440 RepID=A0A5J4W3U8_9EUKA|nr:MAG: putative tubulin polyglutamylase TTLL5 [Streblomastix strix]